MKKKMNNKRGYVDYMVRDLAAARDDRARIFFDYGRTEAIALKKGGKFGVKTRAWNMWRVTDTLRECEEWDRIDTTAYTGPQFTIRHPHRKV